MGLRILALIALIPCVSCAMTGPKGTALVVLKGRTFPVLWGSKLTLRADTDEDIEFGVCRTGVLENCDEGLESYHDTDSQCTVSTEDCGCWHWVFQGQYSS